MIRVSNLRYAYDNQRAIDFPSLEIGKGSQWLLLGESGSGKTTLLHLLGGLLRTQQGTIQVEGTDLSTLSESALDRFRGKHMGFVFQRNHLIQSLSVQDNLLMAPYLAGEQQDKKRVEEMLEKLGMADKKNARINELSQGQAQRVAIARAVMNKPDVLLADEPTSALDDTNCDRVIDLLLRVAGESQSTLLIATHDQRLKLKIANQVKL